LDLTSSWIFLFFQVSTLIIAPIFLAGFINRTKAIWAGRKGQPIPQLYFDLIRLMQKTPVYSDVSSWIFKIAPWIILGSTSLAATLLPILPGYSPVQFEYDFVLFAYLLGLGRVFLILSAMDTGSAFEGMGASREATYSALIEPAFLITLGTLALASGHGTFASLSQALSFSVLGVGAKVALFASLFLWLQIEAARVPVDDPNTHLELTMINEVMILDHSGPELAVIQYASALKFAMLSGLISSLLNPFTLQTAPVAAMLFCLFSLFAISVLVGLVESLIARFRLRAIPRYTFFALAASVVSLAIVAIGGGRL
jgi:formate hydrogenlyase subunit 4